MEFELYLKVHNLVAIQLNHTKLGQMTNRKMVFYVGVLGLEAQAVHGLWPKETLWVPKFFAEAPNTSHVKLLTSWLLALWAP